MKFLETERLILKNVEEKDVDTMFDYRNNEKCYKYQKFFRDRDSIEKIIKKMNGCDLSLSKDCTFAIEFKENGDMVGEVDMMKLQKYIFLGFTISYKYQRQRFAYEILSSLISHLHNNFNDCQFVCYVYPENTPSIKLLEKLGFKFIEYSEVINSNMYGKYILN